MQLYFTAITSVITRRKYEFQISHVIAITNYILIVPTKRDRRIQVEGDFRSFANGPISMKHKSSDQKL